MQQNQNKPTDTVDFHINYFVKQGEIIKKFLWYSLIRYEIKAKDLFGNAITYDKVIWIPSWHIIKDSK